MELGIGGSWPLIWMEVLQTTSTDPTTVAAVEAFNGYFSLTIEFGMIAYLFTLVVSILSRS